MGYTNTQVKFSARENYKNYKINANPEKPEKNEEYLFHIYTLGKFEVYSQGYILTEDNKRSVRMWNLFKYILTHRKKMLSPGELIDAIWGEDSCENPEKALQNLIYRLRQTLSVKINKISAYEADDLILFTHGCYKLNDKIPVWIDCDNLAGYCNKGKELLNTPNASLHEARIYFEKAVELYNGDFLNEIEYDMWAITPRALYKKIYIDCVSQLLEIIAELRDHEGIIRVCNHLFNHEYLDEKANIYFLNALISLNKKQEAQKHYDRITELMYKELGVRPSYEFTEILKKIQSAAQRSNTENKNIDLEFINAILWRDDKLSGAFTCDKETFVAISKVMLRNMERSGLSIMMVLATFDKTADGRDNRDNNIDNKDNKDNGDEILNIVKETEEKYIKSFRQGDIVCLWNPKQILIMLTNLTYEDAETAMTRINAKIKSEILKDKYNMEYTIVPLEHEII